MEPVREINRLLIEGLREEKDRPNLIPLTDRQYFVQRSSRLFQAGAVGKVRRLASVS
jgi:hypothetical protein